MLNPEETMVARPGLVVIVIQPDFFASSPTYQAQQRQAGR
jgi:hypothetical protein